MSRIHVSQKARLALLFVDVAALLFLNWLVFGTWLPSTQQEGQWFYAALLSIIFGSRLDTPFFVKPADVFLYSSPALISVLSNATSTPDRPLAHIAYGLAIAYSLATMSLSLFAMVSFNNGNTQRRTLSDASRILSEFLGTATLIYSPVLLYLLLAFNAKSWGMFAGLFAGCVLLVVCKPADTLVAIYRRLSRLLRSTSTLVEAGLIASHHTPGILFLRQSSPQNIVSGDVVVVNDAARSGCIAIALDFVGRDEGFLLRAVESSESSVPVILGEQIKGLSPDGAAVLEAATADTLECEIVRNRRRLVGLVAPDTTIHTLYFEQVGNLPVIEGGLVEVAIQGAKVSFQVADGMTRKDPVLHKNTHGYVRAEAFKIGAWDDGEARFRRAPWIPNPNAPVYLVQEQVYLQDKESIGHIPGTSRGVRLRSVSDLVTHNTAILGILGVGKTMLALELIERMLSANIKVICLDVTGQYAPLLEVFYDKEFHEREDNRWKQACGGGKDRVEKTVADGGSSNAFAASVHDSISRLFTENQDLLVIDPSSLEVWRQDSKPFSGTASMAQLTPAEITHIISEAALNCCQQQGLSDTAKLCIVYEEAHSLVPEWNAAVADGDRTAANGTARAILQGRKYGLGCIAVTQRTASITKSILNQCNTIFAMRMFDDTGKAFLSNYIGSAYAEALPALPERNAVLFGRASACENPVRIELNDRANFLKAFRDGGS